MAKAWLHRNGRPVWEFAPEGCYRDMIHRTAQGTVYAILLGNTYKPIWIGRLSKNDRGQEFWATCERELRAKSIKFEHGGEYVFPVSESGG